MERLWNILKEGLSKGGHDLSHVRRVYKNSMKLAEVHEGIDHEILTAAVILHDIARDREDNDPTHQIDHAEVGAQEAEQILIQLDWPAERAALVRACIATHRYRSGESKPSSMEAKILYDADKLDSIGYIGIARTYMLAGQYGEQLHIELTPEQKKMDIARRVHDFESYSANIEYYSKLRHIPEKLFTEEGRRIARIRMVAMDAFFEGLEAELDMKDI